MKIKKKDAHRGGVRGVGKIGWTFLQATVYLCVLLITVPGNIKADRK